MKLYFTIDDWHTAAWDAGARYYFSGSAQVKAAYARGRLVGEFDLLLGFGWAP